MNSAPEHNWSKGSRASAYERSIFNIAPHENDFKGLIFDLAARRALTEKTGFEVDGSAKNPCFDV